MKCMLCKKPVYGNSRWCSPKCKRLFVLADRSTMWVDSKTRLLTILALKLLTEAMDLPSAFNGTEAWKSISDFDGHWIVELHVVQTEENVWDLYVYPLILDRDKSPIIDKEHKFILGRVDTANQGWAKKQTR